MIFKILGALIILIIILRLLGISLTEVLALEWVKDIFIFIKDMAKLVWNDLAEIFRSFMAA